MAKPVSRRNSDHTLVDPLPASNYWMRLAALSHAKEQCPGHRTVDPGPSVPRPPLDHGNRDSDGGFKGKLPRYTTTGERQEAARILEIREAERQEWLKTRNSAGQP